MYYILLYFYTFYLIIMRLDMIYTRYIYIYIYIYIYVQDVYTREKIII